MKRTLKFLGWAMLASAVLGIALVALGLAAAGSFEPTTVHFNGEPIWVGDVDFFDGLVAVCGIALALFIVVLVVPLAVLIPLAVALLAVVGSLFAVAGVLALLFSPLILLALAVWLIVRRRPATRSATIPG